MRQARRAASITAAMQRLFSLLYPPLPLLHLYCSAINPSTRNPDLTSDVAVAEGVLKVGRHQDGGDGAVRTPGILLLPRHQQTVAQRAAACPR